MVTRHIESTECASGPGITRSSDDSIGVVAVDEVVPVGNEAVAIVSTASGHVRKQSKLQIKRLHIVMPRSISLCGRCAKLPVVGKSVIRVPTGTHHTTVSSTVKGRDH